MLFPKNLANAFRTYNFNARVRVLYAGACVLHEWKIDGGRFFLWCARGAKLSSFISFDFDCAPRFARSVCQEGEKGISGIFTKSQQARVFPFSDLTQHTGPPAKI